jgi:hypothetical protein
VLAHILFERSICVYFILSVAEGIVFTRRIASRYYSQGLHVLVMVWYTAPMIIEKT